MSQTKKEFSKWRSFLWPVHAYELKKLLPMLLLFFFINFNYTILRDTKDTLIVTASGSGAETIPFLKVWGVLPGAVVFMLLYSKLSNKLSKSKLFYTSMIPFLVFFGLFALFLYPNRDALHPTVFADKLQAMLPQGFFGLIAILRNWTFSLFYIMAELWGSVGISLLFWGFANDITRVSESKRFYAMFGLGANISMLISGPLITYFSELKAKLPPEVDAWGYTLNWLMGMVVFCVIAAMYVYNWINKNVLTDTRFYEPGELKQKKEKPKMSLGESFKFLAQSKYILCIATVVLAYGISINLIEVTWKSQLKLQYPDPNAYSAFMGKFSFITGAVTLFMMLFVGGNVVRKFGWTFGALVTPVVLLATGVGFFAFVIFREQLSGLAMSLFGCTPLMMAVILGTAQNIMSKSTKYSLFDPTKEMAYIPLDQDSKVKGKAAIDVVGARLGKSGGSLVQQALLMIGPLAVITPYIAAVLFAIVGAWLLATRSLGKQFNLLNAQKDGVKAAEQPAIKGTPQPEAT